MSGKLRAIGRATVSILEALIAPQVGRQELAAAVGYIENAGAPTLVVPDFVGQRLLDTTNNRWYLAYGTAAGEWAFLGSDNETTQKHIIPALNGKVGATAGWVITAGTNISHATLPASQTGSTLVIPLVGLSVGDTVTEVSAVGQVESAGNNVTCTMSVRKLTSDAAAALTDAEIGTDNVGTLTADTLLTDANGNLKVSGLTEVVAADEQLYVLLTATTGVLTDIDLSHICVTVTKG